MIKFILATLLLTTSSFAADKWTEANINKLELSKVFCFEEMEDDINHGGYRIEFPKGAYNTYMIISVDKSDDTDVLIGGYDIRAEINGVKEVTRDKHLNGKWIKQNVKVFSISSNMGGVETQIELSSLLKSLNSTASEKPNFSAKLIFPTGNVQDYELTCNIQ